jgi:hypothetical protein
MTRREPNKVKDLTGTLVPCLECQDSDCNGYECYRCKTSLCYLCYLSNGGFCFRHSPFAELEDAEEP